jgi:phage tail sheath protein FI
LFEINDEITRSHAKSTVEAYLSQIKGRRGVYNFDVVCNNDNNPPEVIDNNEMNIAIFIQPTKAAEYINFLTVVTPTGSKIGIGDI